MSKDGMLAVVVVGAADGQVSGDGWVYLYPDKLARLVGEWRAGHMWRARFYPSAAAAAAATAAEVRHRGKHGGKAPPPKRAKGGGVGGGGEEWHCYDPGTATRIATKLSPLLRDPFEAGRCTARRSRLPAAGEGLFATARIAGACAPQPLAVARASVFFSRPGSLLRRPVWLAS